MIAAVGTMLLAVSTGAFEVVSIPLEPPEAQIFALAADDDATAEIAVLAERDLRIYGIDTGNLRFAVTLPENAPAFDVFDADGDGAAEIMAIQSGGVLLIELDEPDAAPRELFRVDHLIDDSQGGYPRPHILATQRNGRWLVAIPRESSLELRALDGTVVETFSLGSGGESAALFERPFAARTVYPNLVGPPGAVEMHIDQVVVHDFPSASAPSPATRDALGPGGFVHLQSDGEDEPQRWPWFSLTTKDGVQQRVLYALTEPDYEDTLIRIQQPETSHPLNSEGHAQVSPERRYRGSLIPPQQMLPDFNADGYTDLLLWCAPRPGTSIQAVTEALTSRSWPLELRVQCFEPEKNRYDPRSVSIIRTRVPIGWFLHPERGIPLYLPLFGDFNGDGRTDVAFATGASEYCAWTCGDEGFPARPSFQRSFPENIDRLEIRADLDGTGRIGAVIRGERHIYVLKPATGR